jgi:DNA polymerase-4
LRAEVKHATGGLTCSVGISAVKFLAKIASGMNKPDGLTEIPAGTELAVLDGLPIGQLWGVGAKAEARLRDYGVKNAGDLRRLDEDTLRGWFGENGAHLHQLSWAIDPRPVTPGQPRKSVSHEDTYAVDVLGREAIERKLLHQATRVADRLVAKKLRGRRVQLKIRDTDFKTETRQRMLAAPT